MSYLNLLLICEFLIFIAVIIITNIDMVSPGTCAIAFFFVATVLLKFVESSWNIQLSAKSVGIIVIGLITILFSEILTVRSFAINSVKRLKTVNKCEYRIKVNKLIVQFFIVFSVVCLCLYILEILIKGHNLGAKGFFVIGAVSNSMNNGTDRLSLIGKIASQYCALIAYPFAWLFASQLFDKSKRRRNWIHLVPIFVALLAHFFGANRHNILRVLLAVLFCCYTVSRKEHKLQKKKIVRYSVLIFAAFLFLFYVVKDVVKVSFHNISFFEYLIYYLSSPIVLFSKYLDNPLSVRPSSTLWGETCFTGFYATLSRWGLVKNVITQTNHTIIGGRSGIRTGNTYTIFMRPYHDFGIMGIIILILIIFGFMCHLYHKNIVRNCSSLKAYRRKIFTTVFISYFFYMFPLAVSDFYVTIESKIMNIIYLLVMMIVCKLMFRVEKIDISKYGEA